MKPGGCGDVDSLIRGILREGLEIPSREPRRAGSNPKQSSAFGHMVQEDTILNVLCAPSTLCGRSAQAFASHGRHVYLSDLMPASHASIGEHGPDRKLSDASSGACDKLFRAPVLLSTMDA